MVYNTQQALEILKQVGITSSPHMLLRWIRQGKIPAQLSSRKQGYLIHERDLLQFIQQKIKILESRMTQLHRTTDFLPTRGDRTNEQARIDFSGL